MQLFTINSNKLPPHYGADLYTGWKEIGSHFVDFDGKFYHILQHNVLAIMKEGLEKRTFLQDQKITEVETCFQQDLVTLTYVSKGEKPKTKTWTFDQLFTAMQGDNSLRDKLNGEIDDWHREGVTIETITGSHYFEIQHFFKEKEAAIRSVNIATLIINDLKQKEEARKEAQLIKVNEVISTLSKPN